MRSAAPTANSVPQMPAGMARAQMADIARLAGVSVSTVSRALNGAEWVSAGTRARVEAIAQALHYQVDASARHLRVRQSRTVSVVVPSGAPGLATLGDPFVLALIGSLADALAAQGHDMLLTRAPGGDAAALARDVDSGRACGLVVLGSAGLPPVGQASRPAAHAAMQHALQDAQFDALARRGLPLVVWGARPDCQGHTTVGGDDRAAGHLATLHLVDQGARRIAFVGDPWQATTAVRLAGCAQALAEQGLPPPMQPPMPGAAGGNGWPVGLDAWLQQAPEIDGVLCASTPLAIAVLQSVQRLGRAVPDALRVVGHDAIALAAELRPALTTVGPAVDQAGPALVQALHRLLDGAAPAPVLLPVQLQARSSSQATPAPAIPRR